MGRTRRKRLQRRRYCNQTQSSAASTHVIQLTAYLGHLGWRNESQLIARDFPETGRGLCSKSDFHTGQALIRLPVEVLLTVATLENDEDFKAIFDASRFTKDVRVPFQCLLALYLLYQKHLAFIHSRLEPYLNTLPQSFSTPYFCTMAELYYLPEAVLEKTVAQNREIRSSFENLQAVFKQQKDFQHVFSLDAFKWSYFVVNTRCVFVQSSQLSSVRCDNFFDPILSDAPNLALVPFLDLFNHSPDVNTTAELLPISGDVQRSEFVLTLQQASAPIQPRYTQLFINYGALANIKLLTEYGFIVPRNKEDFVEFSLLDIENLIKAEKAFKELNSIHRTKFKFIREHNLSEQMFIHLQDGVSHNLGIVLHLLFRERSHYPNILSQVAFGDASQFKDVDDLLRLLISFKIKEYCKFIDGLRTLSGRSESAEVMLQYLEECIRYMEKYLAMY